MYQQPPPGYPYDLPPDLRWQQNSENRGFAMPGGLNTNNNIFNLLGNTVMSQALGADPLNMGPMQGYTNSSTGYLQAQQREGLRRQAHGGLVSSNSDARLFGRTIGSSPVAQEIINQMGLGGGNLDEAYQVTQNLMGPQLGHNLRDQSRSSEAVVRRLEENYSDRDSHGDPRGFSRQKSQGFDVRQSVENLDTMRRAGIGGFSGQDISQAATAKDGGKSLTDMSRSANEFTRRGKQVFGEDMNFDEIAKLMDRATAGLSKVSGGEANRLLSQVQSTSKALDISGKALTEYMSMQQGVYKNMGVDKGTATASILSAANKAKTIQTQAQKSGDTSLSNINDAMAASQKLTADFMGSDLSQTSLAIASSAGGMTDKDLDTKRVGRRSVRTFMKEMQKASDSGDTDKLKDLNHQAMESGLPQFSQAVLQNIKSNGTDQDEQNAAKFLDKGRMADMGAGRDLWKMTKEHIVQADSSQFDSRLQKALKSSGTTLDKLTEGMSANDLENPESKGMSEKLSKLGIKGKKAEEIKASVAQATSQAHRTMNYELGDKAEVSAVFALGDQANADRGKEALQGSRGANTERILNSLMGDTMSPKDLKTLASSSGKIMTAAKDRATKQGRGSTNASDYSYALKKEGINLTSDSKIKQLKSFVEEGDDGKSEADKANDRAQDAYDKTLKKTGKVSEAKKAYDAQTEVESKKLGGKIAKDIEQRSEPALPPGATQLPKGQKLPPETPSESKDSGADSKEDDSEHQQKLIDLLDQIKQKIPERVYNQPGNPSKSNLG